MAFEKGIVEREPKRSYWTGFAAGAFVGTGATITAVYLANLASDRNSHILRLEDSVQIARPIEEVFESWTNLQNLPRIVDFINDVSVNGDISSWDVTIDGKNFKWKAKTVQVIPNEAIGWKSVTGPKHSGQISFSKIGDDTQVHVKMNYAPPLGRFGRMLAPATNHLDSYLSKALRDFKHSLEGRTEKGERSSHANPARAEWRATGTEAKPSRSATGSEGASKKRQDVEYTRPPEYGYPTRKT
jgi:uncharacterized membrane protein